MDLLHCHMHMVANYFFDTAISTFHVEININGIKVPEFGTNWVE